MYQDFTKKAQKQGIRKAENEKRFREKLKRKAESIPGYPADLITERYIGRGRYARVKSPYLKKYYVSSNASRFSYYKNQANRKIRREKDSLFNGGAYKKAYEYQWTID